MMQDTLQACLVRRGGIPCACTLMTLLEDYAVSSKHTEELVHAASRTW